MMNDNVSKLSNFISEESYSFVKNKVEEKQHATDLSLDKQIGFYYEELKFIRNIQSEKIRRIFYSLLCFEKLYWHNSGWIRFEISTLKEFGGLKNLKCEDFSDLVPFGLNMRVTGSKNPVTTYYSISNTIGNKVGPLGAIVLEINGTECGDKAGTIVNASN